MPTLADAIILAVQAHQNQKDKAGEPYYLHPLRVMLKMRSETEKVVAILHDLLEDTAYTEADLRSMGYQEEVLAALGCLTRRPSERYEAFIERIKPNPLARRVKLADLEDNMDLTRLSSIAPRDTERLQRYLSAWRTLQEEV